MSKKSIKINDNKDLKEFWKWADSLLEKIEKVITKESEELRKRHIYAWSPKDPSVTETPSGIYIPTVYIKHRLIYIGYEADHVDNYLALFKQIIKEKDSLITEFAIRTLYELAFPRTQLLFDKNLDQKIKNRYKLVLVLADYAYLSFNDNNNKYLNDFKALINSEKVTLKEEKMRRKISLYSFYNKIVKAVEDRNKSHHIKLCKQSRKLITKYQGNIFRNKSKILKIFREENIDTLNWSYTHLLHGNLLLLIDLFQSKRPPAKGRLKITWALLQTSLNVAHFASKYLGDQEMLKEVKDIKNEFKKISKFISKNYEKIEYQNQPFS
ncbi:hypothetical protein ISS86_01220 [Candidatus Microgenomates bacterium]|nr:hypothetical protein [Candidatus Microgenomates bacterium]